MQCAVVLLSGTVATRRRHPKDGLEPMQQPHSPADIYPEE
eukprot:gene2694-3353_t